MNEVEIRVGSKDLTKPGLDSAAKGIGGVRKAALDLEAAQVRAAKAQRTATAALEKYGAESLQARDASARLARAEYDQESATSKLAAAHRAAQASMDATGDSAKDLVKDLGKAGKEAESSTRGYARLEGSLGKLRGGLASAAKGLAGAGLAAGVVVGGGIIAGIKSTLNAQDATAKLKVQLGLTAVESQRVGAVAGKLYTQAYGQNMAQVNTAIRSVIQSGAVLHGTASRDLQDVAGKVLNLANTFEQDLGGTTRAVGQMIRSGLVKDGGEALDILTRGFQTGDDKAEDLLETVNEYGTQWRKVGLTGAQAMGLISQGLRAGARDSDIVADSIKEFSIRAVDGSKLTADGFKMIGLNAKDMAGRIASGGKSAADGLDITLDRLRKIEDPVKRGQAAVALFGTQAEDLGAALFAMDPSTAVAALGQVGGAAARMGEDLTTPQAKLTALKRTMELKVQSWLVQAFAWFNEHRWDIADGLLAVAESALSIIQPMAGVAAIGLKVGAALLYAAGAAAYAKADIATGDKLWRQASGLNKQAGDASRLGDTIFNKTSPAIEALRRRVQALRDKDIAIRAWENATAAAARVRAALSKTPANKRVTIQVTSAGVQRVQREINSITGKVVAIQVGRVGVGPRAQAHGGITGAAGGGPRSRTTLVGEHGPELVDLAPGSTVRSNPDTRRMLAGSGGGGTVVIEVRSGGTRLDDLLVEVLRKSIRDISGGNVQAALGRTGR